MKRVTAPKPVPIAVDSTSRAEDIIESRRDLRITHLWVMSTVADTTDDTLAHAMARASLALRWSGPPATALPPDRSFCVTDADGTRYIADPAGVWDVPGRATVAYEDEPLPDGARELYTLTLIGGAS